MPRQRNRKTNRGPSDELMRRAANMVLEENITVRQVARNLDVCHVTLHRYIKKIQNGQSPKMGYNPHTRVLSVEQEEAFLKYIQLSAAIYFGLTPKEIRKLNAETTESAAEDQAPPKKKPKKKVKTDRKLMEASTPTSSMEAQLSKNSGKNENTQVETKSTENDREDIEQIQLVENFSPKLRIQHKLENHLSSDLAEIVVDEISLEGLDGITIEALWTRISNRISKQLPFLTEFENIVWNIVTITEKLKFYLLEESRPKLVIFNRFKCIDWDTGHLTEPDDLPEDIYPFHPISEQDSQNLYYGSCANFKSRRNITEEVRQLSLSDAQEKYGSKLIVVADQALRNKALGIESAKSLTKLSNVHYCILERIGRSRKLGEVTAGKQSLLQMSDSKNLFYLRKQLLANNLITKQQFCMRNAKSGSTTALLFHLRRFYNEYKSMKVVVMEQILDIMKRKPDHRIEYMELKKIVGSDLWGRGVQKLIKSAEFKQYVQTDVLVPYRTMYPNASAREWKVKSCSREKKLRVLELVNPPVKLTASLKEDDAKDDSSEEEPDGDYALNLSAFTQIYSLVYESGSEGISLKVIQRKLGLDFYITRSILRNLMKRNLIETHNIDHGRLHLLKYYALPLNEVDASTEVQNQEPQPSTSHEPDDPDDEALSFIADVLQVDKDKMMAKQEESNADDNDIVDDPFKGCFDTIKEYRAKNRLEKANKRFREDGAKDLNDNDKKIKAEEREKYESIFKNEHGYYPMELSLEHRRIEPLDLKISVFNMDASNADVLEEENLMDSANNKQIEEKIQIACTYSDEPHNVNLEFRTLEKRNTSSKPLRSENLLGLSDKASSIMLKYICVSINIHFSDLLQRHQNILKDIGAKFNSENLDFPDDLQSDDEYYSDFETKDKMSMIVNLEESEEFEELKEDDEDVKTFKTYLMKQFENDKKFLEKDTGGLLCIITDDFPEGRKRKREDSEENILKRAKLTTESNDESKTERLHVPENAESILKKVADSVKMDIYMGKNPVLLSHCLDEDNIETTIITTESVNVQPPLDQKYTNKTLSQRAEARANFIIETVNREKYISDIPKLTNAIKTAETEKRLVGMVDRKSVDRLLHHLVLAGYIKIFKIILKYENIIRCKNIICSSVQDATGSIQVFIDQMKIGFFIYAKRKTDVGKSNTPNTSTDSAHSSEAPDSYAEIVTLIANQKRPKYKHSRVVARQYGYVPKFAKIKIVHEFLFYLVYSYTGEAVPSEEVPKVLKQFHVKINNDEIKELGTIYKRELSWKMFIPPLSHYKNWPSGWALICDLILRLPLSLFVKIFNIAYVIPELLPLLNDPVRKHILLKNVPADIRNACLHNRKCIFSIHEILCHLCYIGLLQFGVQKLKEKEQQFVYLNRRAILYDTTSSELGYHEISKKEYPVLQFYFESQTILDNYWSKLWSISMNTKLGQRYSLLQKTITLQDIHAKPDMLKSIVAKSPEEAVEADVGYIPGDKLGACCFDSSTWVHVKRNWIWSNSIKRGIKAETLPAQPVVGIRRKHLEQVKVKSIKYKDLDRELSKKKLKKPPVQSSTKGDTKTAMRKSKRKPITRKVLPRPPVKKLKILKHDELDSRIINKMGRSRAIWSEEEDIKIIICHSAKKFLNLAGRKKTISPIVVRDVMHRLCPNKRRKTTLAYSRRCVKLIKSKEFQGDERYMYHLEADKYLQKTFSKFRTRIANGEAILDEHMNIAFIYLVAYIVSSHKNKFKAQLKIMETEIFLEYLTPEDIPKYIKQEDVEDNGVLYQNPRTVDEIKVSVVKDIIHCSLGWKSDSSDLPLMLYRAYQHYPDHLLKEAISWLRKMQIIAGKKIHTRHLSVRDGIHMAGNLIHNSFLYSFKQITKYPDDIYLEAYQMFVSIYKRSNVEREFLVEKFEQGHGLGLSEIACWHDVIFSFKIPDDLLVLDPKITDHSQLIQELAVRYKFLINQRKNPQENYEQEKYTKSVPENIESIEKAIEVIFEAQKQKMSSHKSTSIGKLLLNEIDEVQLTDIDLPIVFKDLPQNKEKQQEESNTADKQVEPETSTEKKEETAKALQELTAYLGNKQDESSLRISDLAYLLTKGLFPELDDDEERLEKLNKHFLIMYPSSIFNIPQNIMGQEWVESILNRARTKGEEIQEIIRAECIVRNSSHDEEISNSLIDIGGDDEDIKLAFSIVNYIKHKGVYGASGPEIQSEFYHSTHNLHLHEIVTVLIKVGIIFRAGVQNIKFIHVTENETWTVGLDDDRPISELNLNSLGVRLKLMPWVRINGTLNLKVLHNWMKVILSHCLSHPFVMLSSLMKRFNFLKPVDIFSLLEYLQLLDCLRLYTYIDAKLVTIFSTIQKLESRPVNILDGFETIYIETDKTAIIQMGAFQYKGQIDIDIPFEE